MGWIPRWVLVIAAIMLGFWIYNDPHGAGYFFHHIVVNVSTFFKSLG